ncbi:MAG: universal stress protein UspA [Proteobacteria bacterium]|nr:universal stress protein UspA [Pseudomonadota bacterium]
MQKILLPVDGSPDSLYAVRQAVREFFNNPNVEIHLLNVRRPLSSNVGRFVSRRNVESFHREEAGKALKPCVEVFTRYGVPYSEHIGTGDRAEVIVATARRLRCNLILIGTARKNSLIRALEGSTTNRILQLTSVPVQIVSGDKIPSLMRYGLPAGIGAAITALLMLTAAD